MSGRAYFRPHPLLVALIEHLPSDGQKMTEDEIAKFVVAMDAAIRLIYTDDDAGRAALAAEGEEKA